jgi:hypothetical protein
MKVLLLPRALTVAIAGLGLFATGVETTRGAERADDPALVVPLAELAPAARDAVAEIIREPTFHHRGEPETFPCNSRVYLSLLDEPSLTLALWKDLSPSPVQLQQIGPNLYQGTDGNGAAASWEFVYRSPKLHVLLCNLQYSSPRGNAHLEGRIVLVVHSGFYREVNGEQWVQHDVEAFVKIDSKGWKLIAKTFRPLIEKLLQDQVREAGWFVSLMGRLVSMYPNWACQVALQSPDIKPEVRQKFRDMIVQTRRPGAFTGRPTLAENARPDAPAVERR